jgi:tRNA (pseudouridine54-N1)-methyltransferase|tara:strand:+ start:4023 stop:4637 length:615 start_codon:yes stop_codon:yes gene_type:complete
MRHFVYFSRNASTTGNFDLKNLMKAGRMDIVIHTIISGFFLSHGLREDVKMHLVFYGMPDPPKHIEIILKKDEGVPEEKKVGRIDISKKDIGNLLKKILYKYKVGKKNEAFPGCFIEKKSFLKVIEELEKEGKEIFILDKSGEDIRKAKIPDNCVFVLGDHDGLPKKELKRLKKIAKSVSIGEKTYFASQTVAIVNNELDRRGI